MNLTSFTLRNCWLLIFLLPNTGCQQSPKISLKAARKNGELEFIIKRSGGNGLEEFDIWNATNRQLLWSLNLNYFNDEEIIYGKPPMHFRTFNGIYHDAQKNYPLEPRIPPILQANSKFYIHIIAQYDTTFAPAAMDYFFTFKTDSLGNPLEIIQTGEPNSNEVPTNNATANHSD